MGLSEKTDVLKGFGGKIRAIWIKIWGFEGNCPEDQYSEWIEDQYFLKYPF